MADIKWDHAKVRKQVNNHFQCISRNWAGLWLAGWTRKRKWAPVYVQQQLQRSCRRIPAATVFNPQSRSRRAVLLSISSVLNSADTMQWSDNMKISMWEMLQRQHRKGKRCLNFLIYDIWAVKSWRYMAEHSPMSPGGLCSLFFCAMGKAVSHLCEDEKVFLNHSRDKMPKSVFTLSHWVSI